MSDNAAAALFDTAELASLRATMSPHAVKRVISISLGVLALGEQLSWNAPVGAVIIIAGAMLSRASRRTTVLPRLLTVPSPAPRPAVPPSRWLRSLS